MKPVFYLAAVDYISLTHEEGADALHTCATLSRGDCKLQENDVPRFTADRLAEAVAVEREQWSATVANALNWLKHGRIANARDDLKAAQRRAANETIRSTTK